MCLFVYMWGLYVCVFYCGVEEVEEFKGLQLQAVVILMTSHRHGSESGTNSKNHRPDGGRMVCSPDTTHPQ